MDIASLSTVMSQSKLLQDVGTSIMSMQMNQQESQAASMIASLNSAPAPSLEAMVNPAVGGNIDLTV